MVSCAGGLFADAAFALADEGDEVFEFGKGRKVGFDLGEGVGDGEFFAEEDFVGGF